MTAEALYYDGRSARPTPVMLERTDNVLRIRGDNVELSHPIERIRATARLANVRRMLTLPDGAQVHCDDNDAIDALFPNRGADRFIDRLERHSTALASSILLIGISATLFFTVGLPALATQIAAHVPPQVEEALGDQAMASLDQMALEPSELPESAKSRARTTLSRLLDDNDPPRITLAFRRLPENEANAFAIPGGTIVVTDGLIEALPSDDALAAVLAHEIGHQRAHHVLRSILQSSVVVVVVAFLTGDVSSATGVVLAVPAFLLDNHYSRTFEREADTFAFAALERKGISPEWFSTALTNIDTSYTGSTGGADQVAAYLSTHPSTADRVAEAKAAAQRFPALETIVAADWAAQLDLHDAPVGASDLVGCWAGYRSVADKVQTAWWVGFGANGTLDASFASYQDDKLVGSSWYQGRWAVKDAVMTTRLTSELGGDGEVSRAMDELYSYQIDHVDETTLNYHSLHDGTTFESEREGCDDESE